MDIQDLKGFVILLVLTGLLLGVGVLTLYEFGEATETKTTITNEAVTLSSGTVSIANADVVEFDYFGNFTNSTTNATVTKGVDVNLSNSGTLTANTAIFADLTYNVSYKFMLDTAATDVSEDMNTAIGEIPSTWIPLIVTIVALAIVLAITIKSFGGMGR